MSLLPARIHSTFDVQCHCIVRLGLTRSVPTVLQEYRMSRVGAFVTLEHLHYFWLFDCFDWSTRIPFTHFPFFHWYSSNSPLSIASIGGMMSDVTISYAQLLRMEFLANSACFYSFGLGQNISLCRLSRANFIQPHIDGRVGPMSLLPATIRYIHFNCSGRWHEFRTSLLIHIGSHLADSDYMTWIPTIRTSRKIYKQSMISGIVSHIPERDRYSSDRLTSSAPVTDISAITCSISAILQGVADKWNRGREGRLGIHSITSLDNIPPTYIPTYNWPTRTIWDSLNRIYKQSPIDGMGSHRPQPIWKSDHLKCSGE